MITYFNKPTGKYEKIYGDVEEAPPLKRRIKSVTTRFMGTDIITTGFLESFLRGHSPHPSRIVIEFGEQKELLGLTTSDNKVRVEYDEPVEV